MGTEILRPHDHFFSHPRHSPAGFFRPRNDPGHSNRHTHNVNSYSQNVNTRSHRKPITRSDQKRRSPTRSNQIQTEAALPRRWSSVDLVSTSNNPAVEKVTIMRRGASLSSITPAIVKCDVYAGSACFDSPAPSSLPLPSFSRKYQNENQIQNENENENENENQVRVDDLATRDLMRLLGLNL